MKKYFTLIELMAVIFIIVLLIGLISIIVPTFREQGRRTECASNLRQLGIALTSYTSDHYQQYPFSKTGDLKTSLSDYVEKDDAIWTCPSTGESKGTLTYKYRIKPFSVVDMKSHIALVADNEVNHVEFERGFFGNILFGDGRVKGFYGSGSASSNSNAWYKVAQFTKDDNKNTITNEEDTKVELNDIGGLNGINGWNKSYKNLSEALL